MAFVSPSPGRVSAAGWSPSPSDGGGGGCNVAWYISPVVGRRQTGVIVLVEDLL